MGGVTDFLLELRSEEIPARMQDRAREDLARLFAAELAKAGLAAGGLVTYATPRRLALIARGLPDATEAVREETKGPKASAPSQALDGFLRKTGLAREQLEERDGVLFAVVERPGRATAAVLAEAIPAIVRGFPWPKSMRWGAASASTESLRWVRPLHGIVALLGEDVVPVEIAGVTSGAATLGHRFHHPGTITIGSAADYAGKLRACHVIVDQDERRAIIRDGAAALANAAGLELIEDEGLVAENAGLTEWPVPLLGRFDAAFLDVPPEVIQLTARVNQKYFVCQPRRRAEEDRPQDEAGGSAQTQRLANAFICTANIDAVDGGATIVEGNRKVLAARLSDARFFYETDLKVPLEDQAAKLDRIVFHEKLGTVADKVERVAKLARWLVEEGIVGVSPSPLVGEARGPLASASGKGEGDTSSYNPPHPSAASGGSLPLPQGEREQLAAFAERAARLAKADLVTGMVGEFPELQGVMGGYYAAAQGEDPAVAAAVRDHYKPVGQGDEVPTAPVTVAVSLADKLDTLVGSFACNDAPTGSRDPYALRRAAISAINLILQNRLRLSLQVLVIEAASLYRPLFEARQRFFEQEILPVWSRTVVNAGFGELAGDRWAPIQLVVEVDGGRVTHLNNQSHVIAYRWGLPSLQDFAASRGTQLVEFFADRLKVQQREAGVRHDLIDAVFALGGEDDLVRLLARTHALQAFITTEDGANLLAGYKRAANILKKEGYAALPLPAGEGRGPSRSDGKGEGDTAASPDHPHPSAPAALPPSPAGRGTGLSYTPEKDEAALMHALDSAEPAAADAVAREDFAGAMAALATLRAPIDAFFATVTVNDADPAKRAARLALLDRVRAAVHTVADFSKVES